MTEYWVMYTLNGTKHVATGIETLEIARQLIKKFKHISATFGWDLTEVKVKKIQ